LHASNCCNIEVSVSDFETYVPGSTLTETLRFHQKGRHPELNSAPTKSSSKTVRKEVADNHATSNPAISMNRNKTVTFSLAVFLLIKSRVHCFSMQVVKNKCFLLNPKNIGADPSCRFREKRKNRTFNSGK